MERAMVLRGPWSLERVERDHRPLGPQEARLRIVGAGVCGTDLAIASGDYPVPLPLILGHELVGVVTEVGSGVPSSLVGRRVTSEINVTCRAQGLEPCIMCGPKDIPTHCLRRTVLGIDRHDGAFASHLVVPAPLLHGVPDEIDTKIAILTEPLAAALQAFELTPLEPGGLVVILGAGRLGLLSVVAAQSRGAMVLAVDPRDEAREMALALGAALTCRPEEAEALVKEHTGGAGAPVVVEAAGHKNGLGAALALVAPRGTIAMKSTPGTQAQVDITQIAVREIKLQGSRCGPFDKALALLASSRELREKLGPLLGDEYPLERLEDALRAARLTSHKILVVP